MVESSASAITTERLRLDPFTPADADAILSGRRHRSWTAGYPTPGDLEVARWVGARRFAPSDRRFWPRKVVVVLDDPVVIGGVGFHNAPREGWVEIGFGIAPEWRGRGIGAEAVTAFVGQAFSLPGVEEVRASASLDNVASLRTLERAGLMARRVEAGLVFFSGRSRGPC